MADITINGVTVDPLALAPGTSAAAAVVANASLTGAAVSAAVLDLANANPPALLSADATNYVLIQVNGPLIAAQKQQLSAAGLEIIEYVPQNAKDSIRRAPPAKTGSTTRGRKAEPSG